MAAYSLQSVVLFPVVPSTKLPQLDAKLSLLSTANFSAFPISTFTRTHLYSAPLCKQVSAETSEVPPTSREEALIQARSSIANLLEKALRNAGPSTVKQRKQQRQVRLRVELPLLEESDSARASLLLDLLSTISIGKRGTSVSFSVFCNPEVMEKLSNGKKNPNPSPQQSSNSSLQPNTSTSLQQSPNPSSSQNPKPSSLQSPMFQYCNIAETVELEDTQVVVILAPKLSELAYMEKIVKAADPRPVLLLNPDWSAEEEVLEALNASFMQSFEVVYSYLPLVIQGFFSKTEGAVLKHVKSGAPAGRPWLVFVKEGEKMDCVSSLKKRPSAVDLENALYNAMAANSPVSKSIKFLKGLVGKT